METERKEYVKQEKNKFKEELAQIAINGEVHVQGKLYQRLNIFAKKNEMTLDELIEDYFIYCKNINSNSKKAYIYKYEIYKRLIEQL